MESLRQRVKDFHSMTPSFAYAPPSNEFGAKSKSSLQRTAKSPSSF